MVADQTIKVVCANCEDEHSIPANEDPVDEPWFCEDKTCVSAAYRHFIGWGG